MIKSEHVKDTNPLRIKWKGWKSLWAQIWNRNQTAQNSEGKEAAKSSNPLAPAKTVAGSKVPFGLNKSPLGKLQASHSASAKMLPYKIQVQQQTEWCWAANTASVNLFYNAASEWTQCKLAEKELGQKNCCNPPIPDACNFPWYTGTALETVGILKATNSGKADFSQVVQAIDAAQPAIISIGWFQGGGHAVSIYGYEAQKQLLNVANPWGKSSYEVVNYNTFPTTYSFGGNWKRTYWTQKKP